MRSFVVVLLTGCLFGCKSSKSRITAEEMEAFNKLIETKVFEIESTTAYPQLTFATSQLFDAQLLPPGSNAGAISLIGNSNFLKIKQDSVISYLPYFGERQMHVGYGGQDSAIEFNGTMKDYSVKENRNKSKTISFNAKSNAEPFLVTITLFPNLTSRITLNSASRFFISYQGTVSSIE
ncbi:MAG: DUF4251 domain-containing protein [Jejuia sp.]